MNPRHTIGSSCAHASNMKHARGLTPCVLTGFMFFPGLYSETYADFEFGLYPP